MQGNAEKNWKDDEWFSKKFEHYFENKEILKYFNKGSAKYILKIGKFCDYVKYFRSTLVNFWWEGQWPKTKGVGGVGQCILT